jgi:hypothetical protein
VIVRQVSVRDCQDPDARLGLECPEFCAPGMAFSCIGSLSLFTADNSLERGEALLQFCQVVGR